MNQHVPVQRAHGTEDLPANLARVEGRSDLAGGVVRTNVFRQLVVADQNVATNGALEVVASVARRKRKDLRVRNLNFTIASSCLDDDDCRYNK